MNEKIIEQYLVDRVKAIGGKAYKFVSPGNIGVPDRVVVFPGGKICFVELKATGKLPRPNQVVQINRLRQLGADAGVIDSKEGVLQFIAEHT